MKNMSKYNDIVKYIIKITSFVNTLNDTFILLVKDYALLDFTPAIRIPVADAATT